MRGIDILSTSYNNSLHLTAIPLRSIVTGEHGRYFYPVEKIVPPSSAKAEKSC